jgi:RNA polymerase sigma-70 factor (ECF subfamily)
MTRKLAPISESGGTMTQEDKRLYEKLLSKDEKTIEFLIEKYHKLLWLIAESTLKGIGGAEDIEECVSDVFVRLWRKPEAFDPDRGTIKTYISVMAKSAALNRYKTLAKIYKAEGGNPENSSGEDALDKICREESIGELLDAIGSLRESDAEILIRRLYLGEKTSVIAKKLRMRTKDVENRLYQGKNKLKSILCGGTEA